MSAAPPRFAWTDAAILKLVTLWNDGKSASRIAKALGGHVSRNAVIGKIHRLGLPPRRKPTPRPYTECEIALLYAGTAERAKVRVIAEQIGRPTCSVIHQRIKLGLRKPPKPPKDIKTPKHSPRHMALVTAAAARAAEIVREARKPAPKGGVTLAQLEDHQCRWPLGDPCQPTFRFCGGVKAAPDGPYCVHHKRIASTPSYRQIRERENA